MTAPPTLGPVRSPAIDRACEEIERVVAAAIRAELLRSLKDGARVLIDEPWRLERIFGSTVSASPDRLYEIARRRQRAPGISRCDIQALLQAALALRWRRRYGAIEPAPPSYRYPDDSASYRRDMIEAGRGRLLR